MIYGVIQLTHQGISSVQHICTWYLYTQGICSERSEKVPNSFTRQQQKQTNNKAGRREWGGGVGGGGREGRGAVTYD